jgi:hypothetical protein
VSVRVRLDLNFPDFQAQLFALEVNELKPLFKTLKKLSAMVWADVYRDPGLNWEKVKSMENTYTIRLSLQHRAVVCRNGDFLCFKSLHPDHDSAYGRK